MIVKEQEYTLRTSDFNRYKRILPSAILDIFQDVAGLHAKELGCDYDTLLQREMLWALTRVKYEVLCQPKLFDTLTARTWPLAPTRAGFKREYLLCDKDGNVLIKGSSEWVVMHSVKRSLMPSENVYSVSEGFCDETVFEGRLERLRDFEDDGKPYVSVPQFCDIDMNGHVNNTKYANYVLNSISLGEPQEIRSFQIDYRHEVLAGEGLNIYTRFEDNTLLAKGEDENGEIKFFCKAQIEN